MLETVRRGARKGVPGIGAYDECILEAERDGDVEIAGSLRELRRLDLVRVRGITRLLRRPHEETHGNERKEIQTC